MFELSRLPLGDAAASSRFGSRSVALKTLRFSCFRNRATLCEKCTPPNLNSVAASLCMPRTRRTTHSLNNPALLLELARLSPGTQVAATARFKWVQLLSSRVQAQTYRLPLLPLQRPGLVRFRAHFNPDCITSRGFCRLTL